MQLMKPKRSLCPWRVPLTTPCKFTVHCLLFTAYCLLYTGFFLITPSSAALAAAPPAPLMVTASPVLCLPGVYSIDTPDCLVAGPAEYLTRMGNLGLSLPPRPVQGKAPDASLAEIPYYYLRLKEDGATPVFNSLEDARAGGTPPRWIEAGELRYLSYIDSVNVDEYPKPDFFQLRDGGWISASSVARRENAITRFQGLTFATTPSLAFGWVLPLNPFVETKRTPGYAVQDYTGHKITEYGLVQIYTTQQVADIEWYMIGPDEWVPQHTVGRVLPNPNPPEGVTNGRWIEVNLFEQTLAVYDQQRLVFATLIATGAEPYYTRPGLFPIYKKLEVTTMRGAFEADRSDFYYLEDVPYTMYYDQARALHAAYWRTRFGFPQSHGCVNIAPADAHWLFEWAQDGDWVYVWDPSGKTPTDPSFYGEGGA